MAIGSKMLALTVPLAAFLGSATGVIIAPWATEQIKARTGVNVAPAPALVPASIATPAPGSALVMPPPPSRVMPGPVPPLSPEMGPPPPASELPPVPGSGRSPFDSDPTDDAPAAPPRRGGAGANDMAADDGPEPPAGPPLSLTESLARSAATLDIGLPIPAGFFDTPAPGQDDATAPPALKPGQLLQVEVLESLPGRPITGVRVIRPDGTISLGFYGDLAVAGLNRDQINVKLIAHLRRYLSDQVLGLHHTSPDNRMVLVRPIESDRVFVDESLNYEPQATRPPTTRSDPADSTGDLREQVKVLDARIERLLGQEAKPK